MQEKRFSRQLIVLRAVITGYTGHARLIQSGSSADIELRIQAPAGSTALSAALVEKTGGGYRSCPLGDLTADERGQASATFSLAGTDTAPEILAIVQQEADDCKLAMSGFLNGPVNVNWADVRAAACEAVNGAACTGVLPPAEEESPETEESADLFSGFGETDSDFFSDENAEPPSPAAGDTAAAQAGISPDAVWPDEIAALQPLFENQPPAAAYAGSRYTFVHISAGDDTPEYLAGLWCAHGIPVRAAYAVPSPDSAVQPQGLEDFLWRGCEGRSGYWVTYVDAATGEPVGDDY